MDRDINGVREGVSKRCGMRMGERISTNLTIASRVKT